MPRTTKTEILAAPTLADLLALGSSGNIDCDDVTACKNCLRCKSCEGCNTSIDCKNCENVDNSRRCQDCKHLNNCFDCQGCRGVTNNKSTKLSHCVDCKECSRCIGVTGLVGATNVVLGVQLSAAEFNQVWALVEAANV